MKLRLLLFCMPGSSLFNALLAESPIYITTPEGVIVFTDPLVTAASMAVKPEVITDNNIKVMAVPGKAIPARESLVTVYKKRSGITCTVIPSEDNITLKTSTLTAVFDAKTGAVSFPDRNGKKILSEKGPLGRTFQPAVFDGKRSYKPVQSFRTTPGGDQYMFGSSLLVNPVYEYRQRSRELYLPKCAGWYDLYSGKWYAGGQHINAGTPYEHMPVFVKAGSIVPFGPELQYTSQKPADTITLIVYTRADASFNLYEDEGTNYDYEKGAFPTLHIAYNEAAKTVTIGDRKGTFNGMLQKRMFRIKVITPKEAQRLDFDVRSEKEVLYEGKKGSDKIVVKLNI